MNFFSQFFTPKKVSTATHPPLFIVGLGNPGKKYALSRHNFGFLAIEYLQQQWEGSPWQIEKKFQATVSEVMQAGRKVFLVKPETFMNASGQSVQTLLDFYKAKPEHLIVLHDDVDFPFGKIKVTRSSRAAGHNGVKDIIERLGTQDFCRFRLGVGKPTNPALSIADYVLQPFTHEELSCLPALYQETKQLLEAQV